MRRSRPQLPHARAPLPRRRTGRRGFLLADVSIGLAVVATLAVTLFVFLAKEQRLAGRAAAAREATRTAEAVLADLQSSRPPPPPSPAGRGVSVRRLDSDEGGAAAPSGDVWVRVRATVNDRSEELIGLVPDGPELRRLERAGDVGAAAAESPATRPASAPATREAQ